MESKANSLHLRHLLCGRLLLLLLPPLLFLLLLASFPYTMANMNPAISNGGGNPNAGTFISYYQEDEEESDSGNSNAAPNISCDMPEDKKISNSGNSIFDTTTQDLINPPDHEDENNKGELFSLYQVAEVRNQCPSVCQCPSTTILEADDLTDVKVHLGPLIRKHVKNLLRKPTTVDAAIEAARVIDLLKILNESDPKFDSFRESVRIGTIKQLRDALGNIPELTY